MTLKGKVSSLDEVNHTARVAFRDRGNAVTAEIRYSKQLTVAVNDMVAVVFFSDNMADGLIIGVY